jgi:ribosomal protein S18 acetylase RimI-like enzyme
MYQEELPYQIRWAEAEDWTPAMNMIWKTFMKFEGPEYTSEGIRNFLDFITDEDLFHSFLQGKYLMLVAVDGDRIIGAASVRDGNHLSLLFVDESYHRQGVGRSLMRCLCEFLKKEAGQEDITLKAAPYAVAFYRKIGFWATGPEEHYSGIKVTPMRKRL